MLTRRRFDAFRSIFPAGTVSGAPKIRAIELVADLEKERRGAYAGAVGRFNFANDSMDTCIAIRTMTFKKGVAYLQAGGGIVFDSEEQEEWIETINKLGANVKCLDAAEGMSLSHHPRARLTHCRLLPVAARRRVCLILSLPNLISPAPRHSLLARRTSRGPMP